MTKAQLKKKIAECMKTDKALIQRKIEKAIESGAMDITGAEDNYALAKHVLCAVYREVSRQYTPPNRKGKIEVNNIYKHI